MVNVCKKRLSFNSGLVMNLRDSSMQDTVRKIVTLNAEIAKFWSQAHGWAPANAANLMSKSRLDRQVSLSRCLYLWFGLTSEDTHDGTLLLAWANLGALIEGTLMLFLSIHYEDYTSDIDALKCEKGKIKDPDSLTLEELRCFFIKKDILSDEWINYIQNVQRKRNAIHAYKDKDIGTFSEFYACAKLYLNLLQEINSRIPYPDDYYQPDGV